MSNDDRQLIEAMARDSGDAIQRRWFLTLAFVRCPTPCHRCPDVEILKTPG
jgi:hypothetical protein